MNRRGKALIVAIAVIWALVMVVPTLGTGGVLGVVGFAIAAPRAGDAATMVGRVARRVVNAVWAFELPVAGWTANVGSVAA